MKINLQKDLAARTLGVSRDRVKFRIKSEEDLEKVKNVISRSDVKELLEEGIIVKLPKRGNSRTRANYILAQKKKGRRTGHGSRKGTKKARNGKKRLWIIKIRALRRYLKGLREEGKLDSKTYRDLYLKCKSGVFRNKRHLIMYIEQNNLVKENGKE